MMEAAPAPRHIGCRSLRHFFLAVLEDTMRFILNLSHARCLFVQRVYAAQLTPGVLQKPSSSAMINKIFKAIPILRGEKPAGTKGRAELMLLLVLSTKKSSSKGWTWLCGSELRDSSVSFAGIEGQPCHCPHPWEPQLGGN